MKERFSTGQTYRTILEVDASIIERFAELSGDRNPIHLDAEVAKAYGYPRQMAHGAVLVALLSRMIGMEIPGPGAVWMSQSVEWVSPVFIGDKVELVVTVENASMGAGILILDVVAMNQKGNTVMKGKAKVKIAERLAEKNPVTSGTGRVALVTGGSRGIGAAIACRLGATGMSVAVNYRGSQRDADDVVGKIRSLSGSAQAFAADLADAKATSNMVQEIVSSLGQLDVVVHGASPGLHPAKVGELRYSDVEPYLRVYLDGAFSLVAGALPGMVERKFGRFIFLGTSSLFGMPPVGLAAYVAAKHSLWGLVKSMAMELGPSGITTNMVSPGMTVTDLTADFPARVKEVEAQKSPMRRLATAQDTAELVAFLVGEAAGYINGANLPVTGGPL